MHGCAWHGHINIRGFHKGKCTSVSHVNVYTRILGTTLYVPEVTDRSADIVDRAPRAEIFVSLLEEFVDGSVVDAEDRDVRVFESSLQTRHKHDLKQHKRPTIL